MVKVAAFASTIVLASLATSGVAAPVATGGQLDLVEREPFIGGLISSVVGGISSIFRRKRDLEGEELTMVERDFLDQFEGLSEREINDLSLDLVERDPFIGGLISSVVGGISSIFRRKRDLGEELTLTERDFIDQFEGLSEREIHDLSLDLVERDPFIGGLISSVVGGISSIFRRKRDLGEELTLSERDFDELSDLVEREPFIGGLISSVVGGISSIFRRKRDVDELEYVSARDVDESYVGRDVYEDLIDLRAILEGALIDELD